MDASDVRCGIYRTTEPIDDLVPAGTLVYFHNHGDPGPGVYLPEGWQRNRAIFQERGIPIPYDDYALTLEPLLDEGFYRVVESFHCCELECQHFEPDLLVQLGYNEEAQPILFVPVLVDGALALPSEGTPVDDTRLARLSPLKVPEEESPPPGTPIQ